MSIKGQKTDDGGQKDFLVAEEEGMGDGLDIPTQKSRPMSNENEPRLRFENRCVSYDGEVFLDLHWQGKIGFTW